jgi:hypothetical protein
VLAVTPHGKVALAHGVAIDASMRTGVVLADIARLVAAAFRAIAFELDAARQ